MYSNYYSDAATVSCGENDGDPSHDSQSKNDRAAGYLASQSHAILSAISHDDYFGKCLEDDKEQRKQRDLMDQRNAAIMDRRWRRHKITSSEDEDDTELVMHALESRE